MSFHAPTVMTPTEPCEFGINYIPNALQIWPASIGSPLYRFRTSRIPDTIVIVVKPCRARGTCRVVPFRTQLP